MEASQNNINHLVLIEDLEGLMKKVVVNIDEVGVNFALNSAADSVSKKMKIKGYRPGKAPLGLVKNTYAKEIKNTAVFMLSQSAFSQACREKNLYPLNEPNFEVAEIKLDGTFVCEVLVEVKPEITPSGYIGMLLTKAKLNEEEIKSEVLHTINDLYTRHSNKEVRDEVSEGCEVMLDYWMLLDGIKINSGDDKSFVIHSGQEEPFGRNLLGVKMGDMYSCDYVLPEQYGELGGKSVVLKMDIKCVYENVLPTEEQLLSSLGLKSSEELFTAVNNHVIDRKNNDNRIVLEEQAVDKLVESHEFLVPQSWVEGEEKYLINNFKLQRLDESTKKFLNQMAERNVRRSFILNSIYDAEPSLKVTQEEVNQFVNGEAAKANMDVQSFIEEIKKQKLETAIFEVVKGNKVMSFILSNAIIEEVDAPVNARCGSCGDGCCQSDSCDNDDGCCGGGCCGDNCSEEDGCCGDENQEEPPNGCCGGCCKKE